MVGAGWDTGAPQKLWVLRTPYPVCTTSQLQKCIKTANKMRFRHESTANDTSKTAKITVLDVSFAVNSCLNRNFFNIY